LKLEVPRNVGLIKQHQLVRAKQASNGDRQDVTYPGNLENRIVDFIREHTEKEADREAGIHQGLKICRVEQLPSLLHFTLGLSSEFRR